MRSQFRDLVAYQRAAELGDDLYERVARWKWEDRRSIGLQLLRSADSIGANIAEATGRWHPGDQRQLLYVARGSLYETEHWIAAAQRRGLLPAETSERLIEIARTLTGLINRRRPT